MYYILAVLLVSLSSAFATPLGIAEGDKIKKGMADSIVESSKVNIIAFTFSMS